jgi:hypothetical protein
MISSKVSAVILRHLLKLFPQPDSTPQRIIEPSYRLPVIPEWHLSLRQSRRGRDRQNKPVWVDRRSRSEVLTTAIAKGVEALEWNNSLGNWLTLK